MTDRPAPERQGAGRVIRCPGCGGDSVYAASNPHRPFCSARCRGADLGAWASEGYRVPAAPSPEDDADDSTVRADDA
jgi:endogenous inhibitor of DNA gyrase (YacG/DUF329 family)